MKDLLFFAVQKNPKTTKNPSNFGPYWYGKIHEGTLVGKSLEQDRELQLVWTKFEGANQERSERVLRSVNLCMNPEGNPQRYVTKSDGKMELGRSSFGPYAIRASVFAGHYGRATCYLVMQLEIKISMKRSIITALHSCCIRAEKGSDWPSITTNQFKC